MVISLGPKSRAPLATLGFLLGRFAWMTSSRMARRDPRGLPSGSRAADTPCMATVIPGDKQEAFATAYMQNCCIVDIARTSREYRKHLKLHCCAATTHHIS